MRLCDTIGGELNVQVRGVKKGGKLILPNLKDQIVQYYGQKGRVGYFFGLL